MHEWYPLMPEAGQQQTGQTAEACMHAAARKLRCAGP